MRSQSSHVHAICYELGALVPVQSLAASAVDESTILNLLDKGVCSFSQLGDAADAAIARCVAATLERAAVAPQDVDLVLFLSDSHDDLVGTGAGCKVVRERVFEALHGAGLRRATVMNLAYGGCANVLHAFAVADALLQQGQVRQVLLLAAERYGSASARLRRQAASIAADGVASCLVSAASAAPAAQRPALALALALEQINIVPYNRQANLASDDDVLLEAFKAMKNAAADCYEACALQPGDYRWVVMGDYNLNSSRVYAKLLGFPPERTFLANVGRRGHIPFDPLINLADLAASGALAANERVLLYAGGPVSGGVISLRAVWN